MIVWLKISLNISEDVGPIFTSKIGAEEKSNVMREDFSKVEVAKTELPTYPLLSSDDLSDQPTPGSNALTPSFSENEAVLDSQQPSHRGFVAALTNRQLSSGPNSELRQRRQGRYVLGDRSAGFMVRGRDIPSASDHARRHLLPRNLRSSAAPLRLQRPLVFPSRVPESAPRNENFAPSSDRTEAMSSSDRLIRLFEMGFTRRHVNMALRAHAGHESLDNLVSWLLEHPLSDGEVRVWCISSSILNSLLFVCFICPNHEHAWKVAIECFYIHPPPPKGKLISCILI